MEVKLFWHILIVYILIHFNNAEIYLEADGKTDTYTLINSRFGGMGNAVEVPDCNHTSLGPHITQVFDSELSRYVFAFHSHIKEDDDRCKKFDRQRTEIKTEAKSGDELIGYYGDSVTLSWSFKLDAEFQPPYGFCHIHQLMADVGGDYKLPVITITLRKSNPNELQLLHYNSKGEFLFLKTAPLAVFLGQWINAFSEITYGSEGTYFIQLSRAADNFPLLTYNNPNIDFWREKINYIRPKWGIYRSVQERALSRDETVLFDRFCIGKGNVEVCNSDVGQVHEYHEPIKASKLLVRKKGLKSSTKKHSRQKKVNDSTKKNK